MFRFYFKLNEVRGCGEEINLVELEEGSKEACAKSILKWQVSELKRIKDIKLTPTPKRNRKESTPPIPARVVRQRRGKAQGKKTEGNDEEEESGGNESSSSDSSGIGVDDDDSSPDEDEVLITPATKQHRPAARRVSPRSRSTRKVKTTEKKVDNKKAVVRKQQPKTTKIAKTAMVKGKKEPARLSARLKFESSTEEAKLLPPYPQLLPSPPPPTDCAHCSDAHELVGRLRGQVQSLSYRLASVRGWCLGQSDFPEELKLLSRPVNEAI